MVRDPVSLALNFWCLASIITGWFYKLMRKCHKIARRSRVYCIFLEQAKPLQIMPHQRFRDEWLCPRTLSASAFIPQRHQPPTIEPPQRALLLMTHFLRARLHSLVISGILHFVPPIPVNSSTYGSLMDNRNNCLNSSASYFWDPFDIEFLGLIWWMISLTT